MKGINTEIFFTALGLFFSLPSMGEVFLDYIAPVISKDTNNPTIFLGIILIYSLVFIASWAGLFDIIQKYSRMRGILTNNHIANAIISGLVGSFFGMILKTVIFG